MSEILFETIIIFLLILLNGLLAMSEMAIVSSRRVRLQQMAQDGNSGAEVALGLVETPNRFLSTVQIGITLVGIFAGAIGGATIAQALADLLAELPLLAPYASAISLVVVVGTITFLNVVLGELRRGGGLRLVDVAAAGDTDRPDRRDPARLVDVESQLKALPERARVVLVLHDLVGLTHEEIGEQLDIAPGTSKAQLFRARKLYREMDGQQDG